MSQHSEYRLNVELPHLSFPFLDMRFIFENRKGVKWGAEADINGVVTFAPILRLFCANILYFNTKTG